MKKFFTAFAAMALAFSMSAQEFAFIKDIQPYSVKMVLSEMARSPQATYLDGMDGTPNWNYTAGLELRSFLAAARRYELSYPVEYVRESDESAASGEGAFYNYRLEEYNVDLDFLSKIYFDLYGMTDADRSSVINDIVRQFEAAFTNAKDPATGLFQHAWGRANGRYVTALCDVLDYLPDEHEGRDVLVGQLQSILNTVKEYADPGSGMWYQVLDSPESEGNYLESSASIMFVGATLKAYNRGYLSEEWKDYAVDLYKKFLRTFVKVNADGTVSITSCCSDAGLDVKENGAAVAPFIWASLEYEAASNVEYFYDGKYVKNGKAVSEKLPSKELAFSGADGGGKYSKGGKGGKTYRVTTLEDTGAEGSLRYAVEAEGPRIVEFAVSGDIHLTKPLEIRNPYISILGQTAPGQGITIRDYGVYMETQHIIIRYMRFRPGDKAHIGSYALGGQHCDNVIIDHCSISWATGENLSLYASTNVTVQWCIISESLNNSVHSEGAHGYGGICGGRNVTFHHNLFAHNASGNPLFDYPRMYSSDDILYRRGTVEFVNNVVYNWESKAVHGGEEGWFNIISNWFKPGPATKVLDGRYVDNSTSATTSNILGSFFVSDNIYDLLDIPTNGEQYVDLRKITINDEIYREMGGPSWLMRYPYKSQNVEKLFKIVLGDAGASKSRDEVDKRVLKETSKGAATYKGSVSGLPGIIDSQEDVL